MTYTFYDQRERPTVTVVDMDGDGPGVTPGTVVDSAQSFTGDADDLVTKSVYDRSNKVTDAIDAEGRGITTVYDGAGRVSQVKSPQVAVFDSVGGLNAAFIPTSNSYYDSAGNLMQVVDTRGTKTATEYDAQNRAIRTITDLDNDGSFETAVGPNSDDIVKWAGYDANGNSIYSIDPNGNRTGTQYDRANRATVVTAPLVKDAEASDALTHPVTTTDYDKNGNIVLITDPRGIKTNTTYDQWNRATTVTANATAATNASDRLTTESRYDANGNVVAVVLYNLRGSVAEQQVTTYVFDALDRKTEEQLPSISDGQTRKTVTAYSRAGDVLTVTDPKGQKVESDYDRAGRVTEQRFKRQNNTTEETRVSTYDKVGNIESRSDLNGVSAYQYNALNQVTLESRDTTTSEWEFADSYSIASFYDKGGNRSKVVYPGTGRTLVSTYDRANRLIRVDDTGTTHGGTTAFFYDAAGNRTSSVAANGAVTTTTFDAMNRVVAYETMVSRGSGPEPIYSVTYGYDLAGQRRKSTEQIDTIGSRVLAWDYDGLYRLTEESWTGESAQTRGYSYDRAGNRLGRTVDTTATTGGTVETDTSSYDALNRLTSHTDGNGSTGYTYDLNGNRSSKDINGVVTDYGYDTSNRLTSASIDTIPVFSATYDARTRRLTKTEGGDGIESVTTLYRYDGGTNVQEVAPGVPPTNGEDGSPPRVKTELVRAGGQGGGIGSVLYSVATDPLNADPVEHFVYNPVGHTVVVFDDELTTAQANVYEAFGERVATSGDSTNNRLRNTKERDETIGLDNDGFRYYDPATGRYIQRDPIGYRDGLNFYASVGNNPVNGVDPLGLERSFWGKVLGVVLSDDTIQDLGLDTKSEPIPPHVLAVTSRVTGGVKVVTGTVGAIDSAFLTSSGGGTPVSGVGAAGLLKSAEIANSGWDELWNGTNARGVPTVGQVVKAVSNAAGIAPVASNDFGDIADTAGELSLGVVAMRGVWESKVGPFQNTLATKAAQSGANPISGLAAETSAPAVAKLTETWYGPFWRSDLPETVEMIEKSGKIFGQPAKNIFKSDIPKVKARDGHIQDGHTGVEFYTTTPPDGSGIPGRPTWSGKPGEDWHEIPVRVDKSVKE